MFPSNESHELNLSIHQEGASLKIKFGCHPIQLKSQQAFANLMLVLGN